MRRRRKIIMTALLLAVIVVFYFFIPTIRQKANPDLVPAYSADPISFAQEEDLHFFPEGLVICGSLPGFMIWMERISCLPSSRTICLLKMGISILLHIRKIILPLQVTGYTIPRRFHFPWYTKTKTSISGI